MNIVDSHNRKNNICFVADGRECHRCDHHDHEIEDPVGTGRKTV